MRLPDFPSKRQGLAGAAISCAVLMGMMGPAIACSCFQTGPVQAIGRTPLIFSGKVLGVEQGTLPGRTDNITATLAVLDRWKGSMPDSVVVLGNRNTSACGYGYFPLNETMIVLARPVEASASRPAGFATDYCMMAVPRRTVVRLLSAFREKRERIEALLLTSPDAPLLLREQARLAIQARLFLGDTSDLATLDDFHGFAIPHLSRAGRDLRGKDFSDAIVEHLMLADADLRGAKLDRLAVVKADLGTARLDGAGMAGTQLGGANLRGASLRNAVGPGASFVKAFMKGAVFNGASFPGANFQGANLIDTTFSGARLVGADLSESDLSGADLSRADLRGATLKDAFFDCGTRLPSGLTPQKLEMLPAYPQAALCG